MCIRDRCCVPAFNACDIGFDRSFVGAYGHDDRVCSYPAATSLFDLTETPAHTGVCLLVDKEEIGSDGVTGMQSRAFDTFMADPVSYTHLDVYKRQVWSGLILIGRGLDLKC